MSTKIKLSITNRWTGAVIFEYEKENNTMADTVKEYIRTEMESNKYRANLTDADLTRADLTRADLTGANLTRANLTGANLTGANLTRANLTGADLTDANLTRADLTDANLTDADLTDADLTGAKNDFWEVLLKTQSEILGLRKALIEGRVDGSTYEGPCACLVGTIANVKGCKYENVPNIRPNCDRPAERWFLGISKGHTPENSVICKITVEWIDEFLLYLNIGVNG